MIKNERQQEILSILQEQTYASVEYLAEVTYSSLPTIRRDLNLLQSEGYITRNHGGAMLLQEISKVLPFEYRKSLYPQDKRAICKVAAEELRDYQTVFVNESTTVLFLIEHMKKIKDLTVITNGLAACNLLSHYGVKFYCAGGKMTHSNCFTGTQTIRAISQFNADLCFFSSTGISESGQITDVGETEVACVQSMIEHSKRAFYLCDASKIGLERKYNLTHANRIEKVITTAKEGSLRLAPEKVVYVQ